MFINKFPLGLALIASSVTCVSAQDSSVVFTDPVGYVKLGNTAGNQDAVPANTDIRASIPLEQASSFVGAVGSVAGNVLTLSEDPGFTVNRWNSGSPYMVRLTDGVEAGAWGIIEGNTSNSLTFSVQVGDFSNASINDGVEIVECWTTGSLFEGQTIPSGTRLFLFNGETAGSNIGADISLVRSGEDWLDTGNGFVIANDLIFSPGESFLLRSGNTSIADLAIFGDVPFSPNRMEIDKLSNDLPQDTVVGYFGPVPELIADSGLGFVEGDRLLVFDNDAVGINKGPVSNLLFTGSEWRDSANGFADVTNTFELEPGVGYIYLQPASRPSGVTEWFDLQNYISPN